MVFRLEESIAAVCAPSPGAHAALRVCQAVFESSRYLVYAAEALLVVLVEAPAAQPKRASRFELWQVWDAQDAVRCVRFNPSKKAARGALALCIDEGRGVLLMPASATSSRAAAVAEASRASTLEDAGCPPSMTAGSDLIPRADYVKAHLHLHLPRWAESVRWKCDDRLLSHLEWVESGDDLFLLGAGEKLSIWKLVDDSVQVYLQRTVTLSSAGGPGLDAPLPAVPVCHFDVAPSGRFAATAGQHDRIVKLWKLGELSPHEGAPMSMFLPHSRALVSMTWSKEVNVYNARASVASTAGGCEMLFTLDRAGNISIWREVVAPLRSFVLWKQIAAADLCRSSFEEDDASLKSCIRVFGLVNHYWARETPKPMTSINEALLSENTVMDALCLFHYGYGSLNEARRNELVSQRMDSITQMNAKLLGDRSGAIADTHVGETAICAFQTKDVVAPYPTSPSMLSGWRSIKALEFDSLGQQLGAVDAMGHLFLWKFADLDRVPYYRELVCHDKGAKGLAFLNSSSSVATVGSSSEKRNVCVWDTLLPSSKALVAAPACHPAGATSVEFSSTHQLLITGGAGGALSIFDMRQRRVLHTISNAHETPIKTLVLHPSGDCVLSGSAGGDVKIWSLPIFREVAFLSKVHVKPSFLGDAATNFLGDAASNVAINVTNSSWGVTDAVATRDAFFTSGTDGSVQRLKVPSLGTRI
ncbi:DmX protein 1 [Phytophthora cinnamomi]|uniref:DmX protein 1 n=1 Tax=Phytophthora cinnamomi TaxID=4785 RepID=UPI00355A1369|nr:DmX protein 1 [Phytophthora cinnamomi]